MQGFEPCLAHQLSGGSSVCAERPVWARKAESSNLSSPTNNRQVA